MAGKPWFTNGVVEIQRNPKIEQIPEGFVRGRLPLTEEHKRKLSENNGIRKLTEEQMLQRNNKISLTKQNKTPEEKAQYSKNLSNSRKGKGLGKHPWNYKKQGVQVAWNKDKHGYMTDEQKQNMVAKQQETKRKNNTFHTSKVEDEYYLKLVAKYGVENIIRQYKDKERYPFCCDFYIKSEDLFIELNAHWTHGSKHYDPEDDFCKKQLQEWLSKSKTSKYYERAINTWTILDVNKYTIAKQNKLNYLVIY